MFGTSHGTIDWTLEREREAAEREVLSIREQRARLDQRLTQISRQAEERGYWKAAGCASVAQWLAQITSSEYGAALRITETAEALRKLPALDNALGSGELTLDQVAAAAPIATPESDAEIARIAVGKAPRQVAAAARRIVPPTVLDDQALYTRRELRMKWTNDGRELTLNGRLPLEHGLALEQAIWNIAKPARAADKKHGSELLEWRQYTADALVTLATQRGDAADGPRRSTATMIVHLSDDEPPVLEGAGPISPETVERLCCDSRWMAIKLVGSDLVHSRIGRCASWPQLRALYKRAGGHCQYPGCSVSRELRAHHLKHESDDGKAELDNMILLCSRHHTLVHDNHIRTTGPGEDPIFTDASGRAITVHQPHAPPR
jgi:Domain of unknown function (DUF222)